MFKRKKEEPHCDMCQKVITTETVCYKIKRRYLFNDKGIWFMDSNVYLCDGCLTKIREQLV